MSIFETQWGVSLPAGFKPALTLDSDGVYGPQSKAACLGFQSNQRLVADGIVGRATWQATFAAES